MIPLWCFCELVLYRNTATDLWCKTKLNSWRWHVFFFKAILSHIIKPQTSVEFCNTIDRCVLQEPGKIRIMPYYQILRSVIIHRIAIGNLSRKQKSFLCAVESLVSLCSTCRCLEPECSQAGSSWTRSAFNGDCLFFSAAPGFCNV